MRATLFFNPTSGPEPPPVGRVLATLRRLGYDARACATVADDFDHALEAPGALALVAGGDGTVRKVALRLAGRGVPLAILPSGTANNIATSLGIDGGEEAALAALSSARRRAIDVGTGEGLSGAGGFIEGAGCGLLARAMAAIPRQKEREGAAFDTAEEEVAYDLRALRERLARYRPRPVHVALDEEVVPGRFLLVEALNLARIGPGLALAPDADPADGLLDVVLVPEAERSVLAAYLERRQRGEPALPGLTVRRASRVRIRCARAEAHVDDEVWPDDGAEADLTLHLRPRALEVLVPAARSTPASGR